MTTPPSTFPSLKDAAALHEAGKLADAQAVYRQILEETPDQVNALHGLALVFLDLAQPKDAIALLNRCTALNPNDPAPQLALGVALLQDGQAQEAAGHLSRVVSLAPQIAEPSLYLARALGALRQWEHAREILEDCATRFPNHPDVWTAKGNVERNLLKHKDAEQSFQRAVDLKPNDPDALNNLAVVVRAQHCFEDAVVLYQQALALAPSHAKVHGNLGNALVEMGRTSDAEHHLRKAVELEPDDASATCNLAIFLTREERPGEAIPFFDTTLARAPNTIDAWTNLGVARLALGEIDSAEECYRRAITISPNNAEAHYNLAWVLLLTGRWPDGWQEYEWRWALEHFSSRKRKFSQPFWDGTPIPDGTLLLHAEQGLGDAIQCARYVALAKEKCARIIVECHPPLRPLFESLDGADAVIATGDSLPSFDAHAPFMSLPGIFGTTPESIPQPDPYLSAPADIAPHLRLPDTKRRRIGLVWAGSPDNKIDRRRTIGAKLFNPLLETVDADFVSLQVGPGADGIADLSSDKIVFTCDDVVRDFADTAAIISQLDLVVGVDTAVMHLAGALGKPAWMLIPFMPDYRWLLDRDDSPWYSSLRLFRQSKPGDWAGVIDRICVALTSWQQIQR